MNRILVGDDEKGVRELLSQTLNKEGYEVIEASNSREVLEKAEKENPQLILLDVRMPGMDGIEVIERLKKNKKTKFIPVILLTAHPFEKMRGLEAGAEDFISKPFDLVELTTRVKVMLKVSHLTSKLDRAVAYAEKLEEEIKKLKEN